MITYENYAILRNKKGLRDGDVAKRANIPASTFSDWKKGKSCPKEAKMRKIADALGISLAYLMGWSETEEFGEKVKKEGYSFEIITMPEEEPKEIDDDSLRKALLVVAYLKQLNDEGFEEAMKRIGELTELSKYRKENNED